MKIKLMKDDFRFDDVWNLIEQELGPVLQTTKNDLYRLRDDLLNALTQETKSFFVIEHENKIIGVGVIGGIQQDTQLEYLCVQKQFQHKYLGSILLKCIIDFLKPRDAEQVCVVCNSEMEGFFLKNNFLKLAKEQQNDNYSYLTKTLLD